MPRTRIRSFERQPLVCLVETINILARVVRSGERLVSVQDVRCHKTTRRDRTCIWFRRRTNGNCDHRQGKHKTCEHCLNKVLRYMAFHGYLPFLVLLSFVLKSCAYTLPIHFESPPISLVTTRESSPVSNTEASQSDSRFPIR